MTFDITSGSNERIKRLIRLRERKHRDSDGVFLVEGPQLVERALEAGLEPVEIYADRSTSAPTGHQVTWVKPTVMNKASYRQSSQGVIAVFPQLATTLNRIKPGPNPLLLIGESIEKPGNLGAMLRTADATGADGFVAVGEGVDPFNPNVVRSSTGALFTVPIAISSLGELTTWLGSRSIPLLAASPEVEKPIWSFDMTGPIALMVGSEATGLSPEAKAASNQLASIPMTGATDSLNASITLAVMAFEAVRQRIPQDH